MSEVTVVGIDPSLTRTGMVVLVGASLHEPRVVNEGAIMIPSTLHRPQRLMDLRAAVATVIGCYQPILVAMEAEVWMASVAQGSDQAAVQAVLQELIYGYMRQAPGTRLLNGHAIRFLSVNVSQVKKYVGAKQKDQMLKEVYRRYDFDTPDHNIADAYVIARVGWDLLTRSGGVGPLNIGKLIKPQIEVLQKLLVTGFVWEQPTAAVAPSKPKKITRAAL